MTQIEAALKKDPNSSELLTDRARAYLLDGDYENAMTQFSKIIAHDPHYGRVYLLRSEIYIADKNWNAVYSDLKNAEKYGTPYVSIAATERLALQYREARRFAESMPEYDKVIASGLLSKKLLGRMTYQRAEIFLRTNREAEGLAGATEALKLDPQLTIAYMGRARTYSKMNKLQDAIVNYTMLIENEKAHNFKLPSRMLLDAYKERGLLYARLGRKDLARRDLVTAEQCDRETMRDTLFRTP